MPTWRRSAQIHWIADAVCRITRRAAEHLTPPTPQEGEGGEPGAPEALPPPGCRSRGTRAVALSQLTGNMNGPGGSTTPEGRVCHPPCSGVLLVRGRRTVHTLIHPPLVSPRGALLIPFD